MRQVRSALLMAIALSAAAPALAQDVPGPLILRIHPPAVTKPAPPRRVPPRVTVPPPPPVIEAPAVTAPATPVPAKPSHQAAGGVSPPAASASPAVTGTTSPPTAPSSPPMAAQSTPVVPPSAAAPNPSVVTPTSPAPAASPPDHADSRFSFQRVQDTLIRMDSRTGQVSVCRQSAGGWSCQAVPDDRAALESEIGRLIGENALLKQQLAARDVPLPSPRPPAAADKPADVTPEIRVPSDMELDRAMDFLAKAWRRMVTMMVELQREMQQRD